MARAILMQQHSRQRPARPLLAMRPLAARRRQQPASLQECLRPRVAPGKAVVPDQMLVEVLGVEVLVAIAIKLLDPLCPSLRNPLRRRLAQPPIVQPLEALFLMALIPAPEGPFAHPQDLPSLRLAQLSPAQRARTVSNFISLNPCSTSVRRIFAPSFGAIQKPDRSCATRTGHIVCYRQVRASYSLPEQMRRIVLIAGQSPSRCLRLRVQVSVGRSQCQASS